MVKDQTQPARNSYDVRSGKPSPWQVNFMRTSIVLLCAIAIGLALNLLAVASRRPTPQRGEPITSPAQQDILLL